MKDSSRGGIIFAVIFLVVVAYIAIWVPGCENGDGGGGTARMVVGEIAPDFTYENLNGDQIKLSDYIGEKAVVLDFWATWCGPCMTELPKLQEFYNEHSGEVEIIAVTSEDASALSDINKTVDDIGMTFQVIHNPDRTISNMYPTRGIPYLVFIDKDGIVVDDHVGLDENVGNTIVQKFGL